MINDSILSDLRAIVGQEHLLTSAEDLVCYSYDGTFAEGTPEVVVLITEIELSVQLAT